MASDLTSTNNPHSPEAARALLFLCVANSARSQMAEALARQLAPANVSICSAGSNPSSVHPLAIRALEEIGLDPSGQTSKSVQEIDLNSIDIVITLCEEEVCPPSRTPLRRFHWPLPDPARPGGGLEAFRQVRDALRDRLSELFSSW